MKRALLSTIIITIFCFAECRKNHDTTQPDNPFGLPNATQTGAGVFACRINGVNAIAKNDINHIGAWMSDDRDTLNVRGSFGKNFFQFLAIGTIIKDRRINNPYSFQDTLLTSFLYGTDSTCSGISSGFPDIIKPTGSITYSKIDTINLIESGTFSCKIPIPNCDTLNLTDGRFDVRYHH